MLVRATRVLEVLSIILFTKFAYNQKLRVKGSDLWLFMIELVYLEMVDSVVKSFPLSMGSYLILFGYLQIEYRESTRKNILQLVFCLFSMGLLQLFVLMCLFWLDWFKISDVAMLIVGLVNLFIIFILGRFKVIYKFSYYILKNEKSIILIFGVVAFAVVYLLFLFKHDEYFRLTDFLLIGIWSFFICYLIIQWQRTKLDNITKSKELEVRGIYENRYQELLDSVRKRQHDFDNQLNALSGQQLYAENTEELMERQKEYSECIRKENRYNKLIVKGAGSPILTGFFFNKFMEAERKGCIVSYEVSYDRMECDFPVYQLIDIFGVLLDNAIEALENYEGERKLHFILREYMDRVECGVYNVSPYVPAEKIHEMVKREVSTKGAGRGIGLPKVIELLNEQGTELFIFNKDMSGENYLAVEFHMKK